MSRRLRCSSVTYRFRYASSSAPCRRLILSSTPLNQPRIWCTSEAHLFEVRMSIPSVAKSPSGPFEQFQHHDLVKNEKHQLEETSHRQDRGGFAFCIVCHCLRREIDDFVGCECGL